MKSLILNVFLMVSSVLFVGVPVQKARFQRVRCRPDILSANCIEEKGPLFEISESGPNGPCSPVSCLPTVANARCFRGNEQNREPLSDPSPATSTSSFWQTEARDTQNMGFYLLPSWLIAIDGPILHEFI
uniref:Uncharacterized protein n=1 Tax=Terrapene triunguis TaxID=2587831 RepID=A0A674ILL3_9SAUR